MHDNHSQPASIEPEIELDRLPRMDGVRKLFGGKKPGYEPVANNDSRESLLPGQGIEQDGNDVEENPFSKIEYGVFLLLGVAMLWAWNMFLAAAPYFQRRFESNKRIYDSFQAAEISVSTVTNLVSMLVLTKLQANASYPRRIITSLLLTIICFTLLAISTAVKVSAAVYFAFLMVIVCLSSLATGLIQNGLFAFASGFGRSEYVQGIMTGQAVAGVLPCVAQIIAVAAVEPPKHDDQDHPPPPKDRLPPPPPTSYKSARAYFILATCIAVAALIAFLYLLRRHQPKLPVPPNPTSPTNPTEGSILVPAEADSSSTSSSNPRKPVSLTRLFLTIPSLSLGVFLCFSITMLFPVFTAIIPSVSSIPPPIFIPLSFLLWNLGDLIGRLLTLIPRLHLYHRPLTLFIIALARLIFIPLYFLCNIRGKGAVVNSDVFYLVIVQGFFGMSNGFLGSECMIGAAEWVKGEDEKKAVGAWMGLCLVGGLTVGSLLSFVVVGAI